MMKRNGKGRSGKGRTRTSAKDFVDRLRRNMQKRTGGKSKDDSNSNRDLADIAERGRAELINTIFKIAPPPSDIACLDIFDVDYCPNCGYPVKLLREMHLELCRRSPVIHKSNVKKSSQHECPLCGLDLRRVKIQSVLEDPQTEA